MASPLIGLLATHLFPTGHPLRCCGSRLSGLVLFPFIFTSIFLSGCATSHVSVDDKGRTLIHHWGYTRIIKPPLVSPNNELNVTGYQLLGFSVGEGFTLGYKANELIQVPTDCRVLVVVNDQAQFNHLLDHINTIGATDLCATVTAK